jgi:pyrroloquinoline quinone biosynthesis protein D
MLVAKNWLMPEITAVPVLVSHYRFQWEPAQSCHVLLYPEGMVKLNESAGEIISCCDGDRSIADIIQQLNNKFPDASDLSLDVMSFFEVAHEKQWINFI